MVTVQTNSSAFTTYGVTEDQQHVRVFGVVGDLHQGDEGKVPGGETLPRVSGGKDARAVTSGHFCCQDHLQSNIQTDETTQGKGS